MNLIKIIFIILTIIQVKVICI